MRMGNCRPASHPLGASCTLTIYLRPTAPGTRSGEIIIYANAGAGSQTVTLTGTGLANPQKNARRLYAARGRPTLTARRPRTHRQAGLYDRAATLNNPDQDNDDSQ